MHDTAPAYGLWSLVVVNSVVFILFAYSFFKPQTARDWRSFGAFSAFLVALFVEMMASRSPSTSFRAGSNRGFPMSTGSRTTLATCWR